MYRPGQPLSCQPLAGEKLVRKITRAEAAEELEVSLSTLDRMIRKGEVEVRRVFVRMEGEYITDEELLRRTIDREHEQTVQELEQRVSELTLRASELERERDEAREAAATARRPYHELEREYQKEVAEHKVTNDVLNIVRMIAFVLFTLLIGSVPLWWFVLR